MIAERLQTMEQEARDSGLPSNLFNQSRGNAPQVNPQQLVNNIVNTVLNQLGIVTNNGPGNRGGKTLGIVAPAGRETSGIAAPILQIVAAEIEGTTSTPRLRF